MNPSLLFLNYFIYLSFSYNLNLDVYGHRGGVVQLVPEHSIASFTLGAQAGATYLEQDLVISSDGVLIVNHDLELSPTTDVASRPEFIDRSMTISNIWFRGNPNNYTNNQPTSMIDEPYPPLTGWFVHNFTVQELQSLTRISKSYPTTSPLNNQFNIMTFDESLELINNLSVILNRPIGVIPETKHSAWLEHIGFADIELKVLQSLEKYGFVYMDDNDGYYKAHQMYDAVAGVNKSKVILQSFTQESLHKFRELTNGNVPNMFLFPYTDFDPEYGLNKSVIEWALGFSDILGGWKERIHHLLNARKQYGLEFDIATYTLIDDINEYIQYIDDGLVGVFSDDAGTGRVVKELLTSLVDDENGNSTISSFCNVANQENEEETKSEDSGKVEVAYALIGGAIAMIIGVVIGGLSVYFCFKHKTPISETPTEKEEVTLITE